MALENARLHEELRRQAFHDGLTRLANRALFTDRLNHALARGERGPARVAVLFADIDGFKSVNDQLGHARGDHVLLAVADRLRGCVRVADTVARLGGDEFAVLLEDLDDMDEAEHVARRIVEVIAEPVLLGDSQITIGISIGIAFSGPDSTADMLLREADTAMYRAKSAGKARVEVFSPALRRGVAERRADEAVAAQGRGTGGAASPVPADRSLQRRCGRGPRGARPLGRARGCSAACPRTSSPCPRRAGPSCPSDAGSWKRRVARRAPGSWQRP